MAVSVNYLIVAGGGGGGGGASSGAGGGAGGMLTGSANVSSLTAYTVTVGNGGGQNSNGNDSSVNFNGGTITSTGGGSGGVNGGTGGNGGSGGGGSGNGVSGGTGIAGQGNNGGTSSGTSSGSGGGGAGAVGQNNTGIGTGNGGNGLNSSITGSSVTYAGGGGGALGGGSSGGSGGGGSGGNGNPSTGGNGTANTGGGGGGSFINAGGTGGSGIVIIAAPIGTITSATGGTHTTSGGNDIWTFTSSGTWTPTIIVSPSVSDTTAVSDAITLGIVPLKFSVSDSTAVSTSISLTLHTFTAASSSILASMVSSAYKWLTSTLLATQQQFNVRPYSTVKIIDDTVQPNAVLIPTGLGGYPAGNGTILQAPDGSLIAAGFDGSSHISFWKAANMNASAGVWDSQVTLDSDPYILNAQNRVSMAVSQNINGSYHIDISYFNNFTNDGTDLRLINQYSDDGGVTWTKVTVFSDLTSMANNLYVGATIYNLCLATMQPYLNSAGQLVSGWLWIRQNGSVYGNNRGYDMVYATRTGASVSGQILWSSKNVDSGDWTLHSLDTYTDDGTVYVIFSGFRNIIDTANAYVPNYGLWITSIQNITNTTATDLWLAPVKLFISLSNNSNNLNSFTFPVVNVDSAGQIDCLFRATVTSSVAATAQGSTSQVVTPHTNYMAIFSQDGQNFTYPSPVVDSNGNELQVFYTPPGGAWVSYAQQGNYYYIGGETMIWQFIKNNIVADVSQDVVGLTVSEAAGQPSSISVTVGNQNNKWVGNSPSGTGAAAIAKNRKILFSPGYYTSSTVTETVPRNVYFIDDINQSVTSTTNDVTLNGRDLYKKLLVTITKFAFGWAGPYFYADTFDGSTLQNWNQISGTWDENTANVMMGALSTTDSVITLSGVNTTIPFSSSYIVNVHRAYDGSNSGTAYVYPLYIDSNNWLRISFTDLTNAWSIDYCVNGGTPTNVYNESFGLYNGFNPILVKQYDYYKFVFMIGTGNSMTGNANSLSSWVTTVYLGGEVDLTSVFLGPNPSFRFPWTVGFGSVGYQSQFAFFKYVQYMPPNALYDIIQSIATKASVFVYKFQDLFVDYFFNPSQYTGTFTTPNRTLVITAGNQAVNNINAQNISDGELKFVAKVASGSSAYGFSTIFRSNGSNYYLWNVAQISGGIQTRFEIYSSSTLYYFSNSAYDASPALTSNGLNIDITQWHTYRLVMVGGWMYGFIDDVMVAAWNDNNTDTNYLTSGTWGWTASANTTLTVQCVRSPAFWKQIPTFSLNPGDDVSDAITSLITTLRAWFFSDLLGRFKALFLSSSDPSTYTYNEQLSVQSVDDSDKEYISQITVYGNNGIMATATNTSLMAGQPIREEVIVDYTITTQAEAQARANNELTNANQYQNQYNPKQVINVGAELFDSVTVVNTGNNSSGVDSGTRTYAENITIGTTSDYSIEIQTGNL